jgi:xanthine dehydrogenase accessory factor
LSARIPLDEVVTVRHIVIMTTHRSIIDALSRAAAANESVVLATVVRISGSSYGGVGTRMVVRADGTTVGLVSGGCLESDLADRARDVSRSRLPKVVTYDTRGDDDRVWGLGLGCNGVIDVLVEPLEPTDAKEVATLIGHALSGDTQSVLATVIRSDGEAADGPAVGAHALVTQGSIEATGNWGSGSTLGQVASHANEARAAGRKGLSLELGKAEVAYEVVNPSVTLLICGSGPDVVPFVRFASQLGWDVTVVDHRPVAQAASERFPGASVIECADSSRLSDIINLTPQTAAVVMSHHFDRDAGYLESLISASVAYIGMLGPRARTERMFGELGKRGSGAATDPRVFAPVGLDVGGDGPEAIALSIITEVSAVMSGRSGGHLRDRSAPLH